MRRIVHLSDVHFGRTDQAIVTGVLNAVRRLQPHLVAISGDLTQRARSWQFREARAFLGEMAHIFTAIFSALRERASPYASVLGALLELAGEKAQAVALAAEPALDETWVEPPVFDGCSTRGQAKPGQPPELQGRGAHPARGAVHQHRLAALHPRRAVEHRAPATGGRRRPEVRSGEAQTCAPEVGLIPTGRRTAGRSCSCR